MEQENIKEEVEKAAQILKEGGVILYPTDTIWGLGCDARNDDAILKIDEIKKRLPFKSYIVMLDQDTKLNRFVRHIPEVAWDLIEFEQKPLTIVYPEGINLSPKVLGKDKSVAIRITKDAFCRQLINKANMPLVSTSANISGESSALNFKDIDKRVLDQVDYVVNLRQKENSSNQASTIMKIDLDGSFTFLRK